MHEPITFTESPLDRTGNRRRDQGWAKAKLADPSSRFLPIHQLKGAIRLGDRPELGWCAGPDVAALIAAGATWVFLGIADGVCHFAVDADGIDDPKAAPYAAWGKFIDVRAIAGQLPPGDAATLAQAKALVDWHQRHGFCAQCGAPSTIGEAGYVRVCPNSSCGAQHFPRTDPVVIMLVEQDGDCLLGRSARFPGSMYSALAGFMEPGESIEEAVRREVKEEAGISVGAVRYVASQHWPFPSSLMIGCIGVATGREITLDRQELADAQWFSRAEIADMVENWRATDGPRMPPPLSLAHQLALRWLAGR